MTSVIFNAEGLTSDQQLAADGFFAHLLSTDKEMAISGPAGVGKTHLMGYLIDRVIPSYHATCKALNMPPLYDVVHMTATANKAADVLGTATGRPACTIHSFLNLRVKDDYTTGKTSITKIPSRWKVHRNLIIFIDEAYTMDSELYRILQEGTQNCKLIYVGDHCQLPPVMEKESPVNAPHRIKTFYVEQAVRNAHQPALTALCDQLRETVKTGIFRPIQIKPTVIDWLNGEQMERAIYEHFVPSAKDCRVLAYTNAHVNAYNSHIRSERQLPAEYIAGETLVSNSAIIDDKATIGVEEEITILEIDSDPVAVKFPNAELMVKNAAIRTKFGDEFSVQLPMDRDHHAALMKHYGRVKDWESYFALKNNYPDLRPKDASTVHKSQGSTYDTVFIDADNLSTCRQDYLAARLLYVAVSRARNRVIFYGDLTSKYGTLIR